MEEKDGIQTLKCRAFEEISWLRHGFSTRHGGVSEGECASLSFSYQKESEAVVDEKLTPPNWRVRVQATSRHTETSAGHGAEGSRLKMGRGPK